VRLHDEICARVRAEIGIEAPLPDAVRAALRADPGFGPLLEVLRRRTLAAVRDARFAEDAFQEAVLKTWKGRPEMFLKPHDEVLRYLRTATRRNAITLAQRHSSPAGEAAEEVGCEDGAQEALDAADWLGRLAERLGPREREVLERRLAGAASERQVAAAARMTRYEVGRAMERIEKEVARLG